MKRTNFDMGKELEIVIENNKPMVSSLVVAQRFGKQHKHVLDAIRKLIADTPKEFHEPNFRPMFIDVEIGNAAIRQDPAYMLTKVGFSMLAMGFTGKIAFEWRIKYIDTFERMEAALTAKIEQRAIAAENKLLALKESSRKLGFIQRTAQTKNQNYCVVIWHIGRILIILLLKLLKIFYLPQSALKIGVRLAIPTLPAVILYQNSLISCLHLIQKNAYRSSKKSSSH